MLKNSIPIEIDRKKTFSFFSFLSAVLTILLLIDLLQQKPPDVNSALMPYLLLYKNKAILLAALILFWAVFSIPLVVASGIMLRQKSSIIAITATLLSTVGILLLGFGVFAYICAFLSIITVSTELNQTACEYQASIWKCLSYYLTDPGLMTWGFGQFLFGWLAWKSKVLPNWLAIIGMIGGLAGLLTLFVYQTSVMAMLQILSFVVWGLTTGIILIKRKNIE